MKKLGCLALGALLCLSFCGCSNEKAANALKDAIYLEKPVINPANEGKLVIIHGYATMSKGAVDPDLNIKFDSPVVDRQVQVIEAQTKSTTTTSTTNGQKTETKQIKKTEKTTKTSKREIKKLTKPIKTPKIKKQKVQKVKKQKCHKVERNCIKMQPKCDKCKKAFN